jgi:hypothetical protein
MKEDGMTDALRDRDAALSALRELAARADQATVDDVALKTFLTWLARAARTGWLSSEAERTAFVAASVPWIIACGPLFENYVFETMKIFYDTWYEGEWVRACEARSRIEFLRDLYRGSPAEEALARWVEPSEIDDGFRQRGEFEGSLDPHEIPPGTPTSHWWWWYPRSPGHAG